MQVNRCASLYLWDLLQMRLPKCHLPLMKMFKYFINKTGVATTLLTMHFALY